MSIVALSRLLESARADRHVIALSGGEQISLARLRGDVQRNTSILRDAKVQRALLVCNSRYRFLVGLLALLQAKIDVVLPPNMQPGTLRALRQEFDTLVTDAETPQAESAIVLARSDADGPAMTLDVAHGKIEFFTSGSTGETKPITKTLAMFEQEAVALEILLGERLRDATLFSMVTHQHVYGMTFGLMWPLLAGRAFAAETHSTWEDLFGALDRNRGPAAIVASPAHLVRLDGLCAAAEHVKPRLIFTAGAPLPRPAVAETLQLFGTAPLEIFGSTETGVIAWSQGATDRPLWQPLNGVEVATREEGLLRVRSKFTARETWCDLADRVTLFADGKFCFEGRSDRVVKIEGKRVSLQQLEQAIRALPWIADVAVDMVSSERIILGAVAVLSDAGASELQQRGKFRFERFLRRALSEAQDPFALPRRWRFVERMPADGLGKRRRHDIVALLSEPA